MWAEWMSGARKASFTGSAPSCLFFGLGFAPLHHPMPCVGISQAGTILIMFHVKQFSCLPLVRAAMYLTSLDYCCCQALPPGMGWPLFFVRSPAGVWFCVYIGAIPEKSGTILGKAEKRVARGSCCYMCFVENLRATDRSSLWHGLSDGGCGTGYVGVGLVDVQSAVAAADQRYGWLGCVRCLRVSEGDFPDFLVWGRIRLAVSLAWRNRSRNRAVLATLIPPRSRKDSRSTEAKERTRAGKALHGEFQPATRWWRCGVGCLWRPPAVDGVS